MNIEEAEKELGMTEVQFGNKKPVEPETKIEQPADPPAEPEGAKPDAGLKDKSDTPDKFDSKVYFKEKLGLDFENEDKFKEAWSSLTEKEKKLVDTEARLAQIEREKQDLETAFHPEAMFKSDKSKERFNNLIIYDQLSAKMPDKDPELLLDVISKDYSKAYVDKSLDVLTKDLMLDNPEIYSNTDEAEDAILKEYGIGNQDAEIDESGKIITSGKNEDGDIVISDIDKKRMQVAAKNAISKWNGYKSQVEMPKEINLPADLKAKRDSEDLRKQKMTEATEPLFTKEIPAALKEAIKTQIVLHDEDGKETERMDFSYEVGENFATSKVVTDTLSVVRNSYIQQGIEWTNDVAAKAQKDVVDLLHGVYAYKNLGRIATAAYGKGKFDSEEKNFISKGKPRPLRSEGTQRSATKDQKKEAQFYKDAGDILGFEIK